MTEQDRKYYVTLTGGKNNAGDFLIKCRAGQLLSRIRSDRDVYDIDGWEKLSELDIDRINKSKALILLGGPALQKRMRPRVYALTQNLNDIEVPILTMGIGWHSPYSDWHYTHSYPLSRLTLELLDRVNSEAYISSVRDYHSQNVLRSHGFENFTMTGCPALFGLGYLDTPLENTMKPKRIGFSLGVSIKRSRRMERQMKEAILSVRDLFQASQFDVLFHHGIGSEYLETNGASIELYEANMRFKNWLELEGISYRDLSGSAEGMEEYYGRCDLHIGYRVHAHIYMTSISKPSVLLIEDGRGEALHKTIGGVALKAYRKVHRGNVATLLDKVGVRIDNMVPSLGFVKDLSGILSYEISKGVQFKQPQASRNALYPVMKQFLESLP